MSWFKRSEKGIQTKTEEKKTFPKGYGTKPQQEKIVETQELASNFYVSPEDDYHVHIGSKEYFEILFDDNHFKELDDKIKSKDFLKFTDSKKYVDRLKDAQKKTGLKRRHPNCRANPKERIWSSLVWILLLSEDLWVLLWGKKCPSM